jgi:hypothetical protein
MKKQIIIALASIVLGLAACKKEYTCECTTVDTFGTTNSTHEISKTSKSTAEAICGNSTETYTQSATSASGTTPVTAVAATNCDLK